MEWGDIGPTIEGPFLADAEEPKEIVAGSAVSGLVGGVIGGVSSTAGVAGVVVSLPGLVGGIAIAATGYATACGVKSLAKWLCNRLR